MIVTTEWTRPGLAGFMTISTVTAQSVMGNTTTYISTIVVSSFGREQSGNYTCKAIVDHEDHEAMLSPQSNFLIGSAPNSKTEWVTVGNYAIPYNM